LINCKNFACSATSAFKIICIAQFGFNHFLNKNTTSYATNLPLLTKQKKLYLTKAFKNKHNFYLTKEANYKEEFYKFVQKNYKNENRY
jgi:hypothetical protein